MAKILYIYDDKKSIENYQSLFNEAHSLTTAKNNEVIFTKDIHQEFDAVITDVFKPREAETTVKIIRNDQQNKTTPIIVITSSIEEILLKFHEDLNVYAIELNQGRENLIKKINFLLDSENKKVSKKFILDKNFINLITSITLETMNTLGCCIDSPKNSPFTFKGDLGHKTAITTIAPINSSAFTGFIALAFPQLTFLKIVETILFEKHDEINEENIDTASEINNIIYGQIKKQLSQVGHKLSCTIPKNYMGDVELKAILSKGSSVIIPFNSNFGEFSVSIGSN